MDLKLRELRQQALRLPLLPGVYLMKNAKDEIIYIGKAKALKNRVSSYFGSQERHSVKVQKMVGQVDHFDYIVAGSEFEALVLECSLIKQHLPKYNVLLKDDKGYSYIRVSQEEYPKITAVLQREDDGAEYIGPYLSSFAVRQSVDAANKIFRLAQCGRVFPRDFGRGRPCLNYYISRCCGLCTGKVSKAEYDEALREALAFLKGDSRGILRSLKEKMKAASENLEFERAAALRDRILSIEKLKEKQKVVFKSVEEQDVFAAAELGGTVCLAVLRFADGRLFDSEHFFVEKAEEAPQMRRELLASYYAMRKIPRRVTADGEVEDAELLERWLSEKKGKKVTLCVPERGEQAELVRMCRENAEEKLALKKSMEGRDIAVLDELKTLLGLSVTPEYIEAYDISHTAGADAVGGMVVFRGGGPERRAYRRFVIKSFAGNDDCRAMNEVLSRRFNEYERNRTSGEGFGRLPDLILLDGGLGQVRAVQPVLRDFGLDIPLFGLVKDGRHRTRAVASGGGEIAIQSKRQSFALLSEIQNEAHRFAVTYHRQKRAKRSLALSLTRIEGVGEKRAKALLGAFKTLSAIRSAQVGELERVSGISRKTAEAVYEYYHKEDAE